MIWIDITDPKYVLFFKDLIPLLQSLDKVVITTRKSQDYDECARLLELFDLKAIALGGYGGIEKKDKFQARLQRQKDFLKLFEKIGTPRLFITGVSVEGTHTAFALGIPIVQFSDTPVIGSTFSRKNLSIVAKLTLPLSSLIFHPFVVPKVCYSALGIQEKNIIPYDFIDVALWLKDMKLGNDFREKYNISKNKPTLLIREEEYKAHYVKQKLPIIYESIALLHHLDCNIVIMPRYEKSYLVTQFSHLKNIFILDEKLQPQDFYPFIDILIGGGGTMNLESCYLGIPTISTRSICLFHDKYLLDNGLMQHCQSPKAVYALVKTYLQQKIKRKNNIAFFQKETASFEKIFLEIKKRFFK